MKVRMVSLLLLGALAASAADPWLTIARAQPATKPAQQRPPRKHLHDQLPILHWDLKLLERMGVIASTKLDTENRQVIWIIETKQFENPGRILPHFFDDEGSRLNSGPALAFTLLPRQKDDKKVRVQVVLKLPSPEIVKESFRVVLEKQPE